MPGSETDPPFSATHGEDADVGPVAHEPRPPFVLPPLPTGRRARRFRLDTLTVDVLEGALPDAARPVDAIVSADDNYLSHAGGVSADLWRAAGPEFAEAQERQSVHLVLGAVHVTTAGLLPARFLFHAVTIDLDLNRTMIPAHLPIVYRKLVRTAREHDCASLALPLLAAGAAEISPTLSAVAFAHAVRSAPGQGPLRHVLLYVLPDFHDTVGPALDNALAHRQRDPRWWITGAVTYMPKEDARELQRLWRKVPADPDWRVAVSALLEAAVQRAHVRIADRPDAASERVRGSIAEARMARSQIEHAKGRLADEELGMAWKAVRDLGEALCRLPAVTTPRRASMAPSADDVVVEDVCADGDGSAEPAIPDAATVLFSAPAIRREALPERLRPAAALDAPSPPVPASTAAPEPPRTITAPEARPEAEGGTSHVRQLHQLLLSRLAPAHLDALAELLEKQGYRGDRDFRLLEHLVRQDPSRLLRQFFSVFDLRGILEQDYGLRPPADLSHRQAAALVLKQLGFQPPRRPRGLLAALSTTRDAVGRARILRTPGPRLRGDVVEVGSQLEYVCHVLLRFVSQVIFECPPEVLLREKLAESGALDKAGLGQLFSLVDYVDARARREMRDRWGLLGFPPRPLLPDHGKGDLPDARNHFAHTRLGRRTSGDDDLARGRRFLEGAERLLDYLADTPDRVFPTMIVVRAIHYDRWGRRKVSAETETGERETLFTERPLRPGEAYMMRPMSNPLRVDPLLVPAGDFGL
ncbi:MAG: macro domain-containing protein [Vicinamibacteria bacterium]